MCPEAEQPLSEPCLREPRTNVLPRSCKKRANVPPPGLFRKGAAKLADLRTHAKEPSARSCKELLAPKGASKGA